MIIIIAHAYPSYNALFAYYFIRKERNILYIFPKVIAISTTTTKILRWTRKRMRRIKRKVKERESGKKQMKKCVTFDCIVFLYFKKRCSFDSRCK